MNIKKIAQTIISVILIYCSYFFIVNDFKPTYLDCGKIISKSSDEFAIKRGVRTELYLNVQFNKSGFRSIECEPTTYFSKKIGDNVCFELNKDVSVFYFAKVLVGLITLVILAIIIITQLVSWLIPESWLI